MPSTNTGRLVEFNGTTYLLREPEPFCPMLEAPKLECRNLMRDLAFAYVGMPSAAGLTKPLTEFGELVETGRMHDRARATWFKRKRNSKTVRRNAP